MRSTLLWCLLCCVLTGCTHMHPDPGATNATTTSADSKKVAEVPRDPDLQVIDPLPLGLSSPEAASLGQDPAEPLEQEVTQPPKQKGTSIPSLSDRERQALRTEPEIHFELDIQENDIVKDYFIYYSKEKHTIFQRWIKRAEPYLPYIRKVFTDKGLPQDLIFLPFAESGFNPLAYSHAGAAGLWQFMPATGRMFGLNKNWWVDKRRDPYASTVAAAAYLKQLHERFEDWYLVLAAYNAGGGHVSRAMRRCGSSDYFDLASSRQLHSETCRYVPKFLAVLKIMRNLESLGFEPLDMSAPSQPSTISVPPGTDLAALAENVGLKWSTFQHQNPAFRRAVSPPSTSPVYLPREKLSAARAFVQRPVQTAAHGAQRYRIKQGDTWWRLARRFGVPLPALKDFNQASSNLLRPGQWVLIPRSRAAEVSPPSSMSGPYTVRSGDTLWSIARRLGTTVQALRTANPGIHPQRLHQGQRLALPGQNSVRRIASKRANYQIKSGDTLWGIARRFDLSLNSLIQANGLNQDHLLKVGSSLYIPDKTCERQRTAQRAARRDTIKYQVRKGDNVWAIARKFGVSTGQLLTWNRISSQDLIHPGDTLTIYVP